MSAPRVTIGEATFSLLHGGRARGYGYSAPRWRCDTCGRSGLSHENLGPDVWAITRGWATACTRGHAPCRWCGRMLTVLMDGRERVHTRCPERPDPVEGVRLAAMSIRDESRGLVVGNGGTCLGVALNEARRNLAAGVPS